MAKIWLGGLMVSSISILAGGCADVDYAEDTSELNGPHGELSAPNRHGVAESFSTLGPIDTSNAFFRTDLGSNGRSCVPCHDPLAGWTISAAVAEDLFKDSDGLDPLFRIHDVGTRPDAPTATKHDRKRTYKPMTDHGLVRFPTAIAATAEFEVLAVNDPYGFGTPQAFTRFRRPTPTVNEAFVASVTWTGGPHDVFPQLALLFNNATRFHGQGPVDVPQALREEAATFQFNLFHAQARDKKAGRLDAGGARGGPVHLSQQDFFIGMNSGASFNPKVFDIYDAWNDDHGARGSIARGQAIFNFKQFVGGTGNLTTCSSCHNTPNVGSSSTMRFLRVGTEVPTHKTAKYLPVVTVRNKTTGEVMKITDFGRAVSSGLWSDIGRFKVPQLRGLASRAPYFHNGRAETISDVVDHYNGFFSIGLSGSEQRDLEAFLSAL